VLLATRRRLAPVDIDAIEFDEDARWLRVRRGKFELVMNFAPHPRRVPCSGDGVVLATSAAAAPAFADGWVELDAMSGAMIATSGPVIA
jgi:maltooligosyltrehalose trehalohydrolase